MNTTPLRNLRSFWLIIAILTLTAAARILGAGSFPVWTDEGWSIWAASSHQLDTILSIIASDRHPPLYFLALSAWSSFADDSHLALRFLSIAGGILTVAITYRISADVFGKRAGVFAALLLAALPSAVYYSQEVRHYGWLTLFTAFSWLCFLRCLRTPRRSLWIMYVISLALLFYTQYFGALVVAMQAVVGLLLWRVSLSRKRDLVLSWLAAALLYSPWLYVILTQQAGILGSGIAGFPGTYTATLENLLPIAQILLGQQVALTGALYVLGAWAALRSTERRQPWQVLRREGLRGGLIAHATTLKRAVVLGGIGLFVLMFAFSREFDFLSARTLVFLTPLLMVVCGYALALMERRTAITLAAAFVVVSAASPQIIQSRLNTAAAVQTVARHASAGDLVVLEAGWDDNAFAYELGQALPDGVDILRTLPWTNDRTGGAPVIPQIEADIAAHDRIWVVQWLQSPQVLSYLDEGGGDFRPALSFDTPAGDYGERFGDDTIRAQLFERPDTTSPQVFNDQFALQDVLFTPTVNRGDHLNVDLWWTALAQPSLDYSVGVYLLDAEGVTRAEDNAAPQTPTTLWTSDMLIFDRHALTIPANLSPGTYRVAVSIYWYADPTPLPVDGEPYAVVGEVIVENDE